MTKKNILDSDETIVNAEILGNDTPIDSLENDGNIGEQLENNEILDDNVIKIKPKEWKGKTIDRIQLDYSKLTGRVIAQSEKQFTYAGFASSSTIFQSSYFQLIIASKITGIDLEFFLDKITGAEAAEICVTLQGFLMTGA